VKREKMTTDIKTEEKTVVRLSPPKMWKVLLMNDDHTPMEFVIELLMGLFGHNEERSKEITIEIHNTGSGIAGVYPYEIAEQRGVEATSVARANGSPLRIQVEEE
jgi:ATP-dependent Clp protease adaptor protein ClpS